MKKIMQKILAVLAKLILKKYKPDVVGITGSFGKTSTKEAIYTVLSSKFNVRQNIKNYNNEIGLPLTIIGSGSGGRSVLGWLRVLFKAGWLLVWKNKNYPKILVLEMAVDRPGDMIYLTDLAPCKIGVVTSVGPAHLEFFKTIEKIAKEKSVMVSHIDKNGWAILNCDNEYVCQMANSIVARTLTYGLENGDANVKAGEINISESETGEISGLSFKLTYQGSTVPILLPSILGEHFIYSALAAAAVGIIYEMNLVEISQALKFFKAPKGRMNLIYGVKRTYILDDTYNASPDTTLAALKVLGQIKTDQKKFAILGDMLELGDYNEEGHQKVGEAVVNNSVDYLVTVGERAKIIANEAERQGMNGEHIFSFLDTERAGRFLQDKIEQGDYILIKGSQGMRLERIVKEIMAEPQKAKELLVRQDRVWE